MQQAGCAGGRLCRAGGGRPGAGLGHEGRCLKPLACSSATAAHEAGVSKANVVTLHTAVSPITSHRAQVTAQRLQHENETLRRQLGDLCAK